MNLEKKSLQAGLLYFALIPPGILAFLWIPDHILSKENPSIFILNNLWLIILWMFLDIIILVIEVYLTIYLKQIFDSYHKHLSKLAFYLRMLMVAVMVVNLGMLIVLLFDQGNATNYVLYHLDGTYSWQIPFSLHVFLLGYLVASKVKTKWAYLGYVLILGSFGYLLDSTQYFWITDSAFFAAIVSFLLIFVTLGEIGMAYALVRRKVLLN